MSEETTNEITQDVDQEDNVESGADSGVENDEVKEADDQYHFPHDAPLEHWDADFGDSKEVYEGTALPLWLLAGWAIFILWAVAYLAFGLPTAF